MSDLDDFFAKRLEEEANFPNRGKNWKQMSNRLDAFDSGAQLGKHPALRGWQTATLAAVAVAGFLLWKTLETRHENAKLRQEVATLQTAGAHLNEKLPVAGKQSTTLPDEITSNNISSNTTNTVNASKTTLTEIQSTEDLTIDQKPSRSSQMILGTEAAGEALDADVSSGKSPHGQAENPNDENSLPRTLEENTSSTITNVMEPGSSEMVATIDSAQIAMIVTSPDTLDNAPSKIDTLLAQVAPLKDTIAVVPSLAQEIKPARIYEKSRFRVGPQATIGFVQPRQKGVSALRGQGFMLEARVLRSLWVSASVDWLHHEVSTEEFVPKFHPHHDSLPEPPNGGGGGMHPSKLVLVESTPREQHYGLGLRYELPVRFWLRPSIRVAHEWVRVSPTLVTYKYEEDDPGGPGGPGWHDHDPEYTAEKFDAQWLKNQWRFGIGLEKDIPNWTFGLWADYSKDFSVATPSYDAIYMRAGVQFRF